MQTAKVMAEIGDRPEATGGDSPAISALKWNGASNGSFISMSCDGREALMLSRFFSYGSATEDDFEALLSELLGETLELRSALRCGNSAVGKME
jgi:hypothetical protein